MRNVKGTEFGKGFMNKTVTIAKHSDGAAKIMNVLEGHIRDTQKRLFLPPGSHTNSITFVNWSAPCTISAQVMRNQLQVMTMRLEQPFGDHLGLVQMPIFTWQPGKLYLAEVSRLNDMGDYKLNFDRKYVVPFETNGQGKDARPHQYEGRMVVGPTTTLSKTFWAKSVLYNPGRTEPVRQPQPSDMIVVEEHWRTHL